jgi:hypothetical protein
MYQGWSVPHREEGCVHLREIGAIADLAGGSFPTGTGRDHDNDVHDVDNHSNSFDTSAQFRLPQHRSDSGIKDVCSGR